MGIFAREERTDLNSVDALNNAVIASYHGYGLEPKLKQFLPEAKIVRAADPQGMFRLVSSGKADAAIQGLAAGEFMLKKNLINNVVNQGEFLARGESRLQAAECVVRKDLPHLMSIIDKAYASINEAEKQSKWNEWFGKNALKAKTSSILLSDQELAWIAQDHTVEVRVVKIPPYTILKKSTDPQGIPIDYLKLISERTGVRFKYNFSEKTFPEAMDGLEKHLSPDLISSLMRTPEKGGKKYCSLWIMPNHLT